MHSFHEYQLNKSSWKAAQSQSYDMEPQHNLMKFLCFKITSPYNLFSELLKTRNQHPISGLIDQR